jgi:hypothetical protein
MILCTVGRDEIGIHIHSAVARIRHDRPDLINEDADIDVLESMLHVMFVGGLGNQAG